MAIIRFRRFERFRHITVAGVVEYGVVVDKEAKVAVIITLITNSPYDYRARKDVIPSDNVVEVNSAQIPEIVNLMLYAAEVGAGG